jgi:hypothetical protein
MFEQFTNKEVAENFEPTFGIDCTITKQQVYHGLLSNITPQMAEALITGGSNLLQRKTPTNQQSEHAE